VRSSNIAALGEAEFERVRQMMLAGAVIEFVRESGYLAGIAAATH
jgi:hypothetical protein